MIFARKSDTALAGLVKLLDESVVKHEAEELRVFVNLLGPDQEALETEAKEFAAEHEFKNVPIVVPVEFENGPENFGISPDADVTVIMYSGGEVKANHAFAPDALTDEAAAKVVEDLPTLLE